MSRGFSKIFVGQVGLRYKTVRNFNLEAGSRLFDSSNPLSVSRASISSIFTNFRYDTRDSFINTSTGFVLQGEGETTVNTGLGNVNFHRLATWIQYYNILFYPGAVLAMRLNIQSLFGDNIPVQFLLPIGGGSTLRGSPQDRFLGKTAAIFNTEVRFPIIWKFGGVVGLDAGRVWDSLGEFSFRNWATNPTIGLRFFMVNFLIRLDIGLGKHATGFYFQFGHIF